MKLPSLSILAASGLFLSSGQATIIMEYTFDELNPASPPTDAVWLPDASGNNHGGFYGGGGGAAFTVPTDTLSGTSAVGVNGSTELILRPNLTGRIGQPAGDSPTPSPYPSIGPGDSWTMEAVIRVPASFTGIGGIMANEGAGAEWWWTVEADGSLQFLFDDGTATVGGNAATNIKDGAWHHVALVFARDAGTPANVSVSAFVDYAQIGTPFTGAVAGTVGQGTRDINLGGFVSGAGNRRLTGDLDHIRISDEALTTAEFIQVIPEPSGMALLMLGGGALLMYRRGKR